VLNDIADEKMKNKSKIKKENPKGDQ